MSTRSDKLPSHAVHAADIQVSGELPEGRLGEIYVIVGAAFAAVNNSDAHGSPLV